MEWYVLTCVPSACVTSTLRLAELAACPSPPEMCQALRIMSSKYESLSTDALTSCHNQTHFHPINVSTYVHWQNTYLNDEYTWWI
jgi:hypothetical protein